VLEQNAKPLPGPHPDSLFGIGDSDKFDWAASLAR
jgi:hypothetical protein